MVKTSWEESRQPIDLQQLKALEEKVGPGGGWKEIVRLVEQVNTGREISLDDTGKFKL